MKAIIKMGSVTIESNGEVRVIKAIDYEDVDGWVASHRELGDWTRWTRPDRARVFWDARRAAWLAIVGGALLLGARRPRAWATAEAARRNVDREFPMRALTAGGAR